MMKAILVPYYDHQRRTTLLVSRAAGVVKHIPMGIDGFEVEQMPEKEFDDWYKPMVNYPADKAAQLFLGYSQTLGASKEVLDYLGQVITISKKEYDMAIAKKTARAAVTPEKKPRTRSTENESAPVKAGRATDKAATPTKSKATKSTEPKVKGEKKPSAAQMFQTLLMEGKKGVCIHTDDEIFTKVKAEFGLDDSKRSYVKWYRNHLNKQGQNPPAAKMA